jgi:hypothetical protein
MSPGCGRTSTSTKLDLDEAIVFWAKTTDVPPAQAGAVRESPIARWQTQ